MLGYPLNAWEQATEEQRAAALAREVQRDRRQTEIREHRQAGRIDADTQDRLNAEMFKELYGIDVEETD